MSQSPDLKGSSFTLSVLHLFNNDISETLAYLDEKVAKAPSFFTSAPVVLNITKVEGDIDFTKLKQGILNIGMIPVGVTGSKDKRTQNLAKEAGLAIMSAAKSPSQAPADMEPVKVIHTPVRSGQQIYAKNGDLVILNHISAGAEVIADGSIHIHGTLRGRAIAGASGQKAAKIICNDLQAELVSIAGNYWLSDQIKDEFWQKKVMLSLASDEEQNDVLSFQALNI
ncbi:septum site-determining protein MinC [Vibrio albus]|jgi:septum site-determining protein MinC|uniref:Probable septum site-determining protein MinC n=1 Tax=Vibrio albus TaxID=2200953 RepID=A0A2U3BC68_9VIBR|nr:septum site-determining protein MinC [Vibrio albus]PWI34324.1 septum site-determining protein MinC [Vibrio albus]